MLNVIFAHIHVPLYRPPDNNEANLSPKEDSLFDFMSKIALM
jgi:hypothetical protein